MMLTGSATPYFVAPASSVIPQSPKKLPGTPICASRFLGTSPGEARSWLLSQVGSQRHKEGTRAAQLVAEPGLTSGISTPHPHPRPVGNHLDALTACQEPPETSGLFQDQVQTRSCPHRARCFAQYCSSLHKPLTMETTHTQKLPVPLT